MVPSVLLQRDPWVEALVLFQTKGTPPSKCFLCQTEDEKGNWLSTLPSRKWALFLTVLKGTGGRASDDSSPSASEGHGPLAACPSCVTLMNSVWDLEERLQQWNRLFDSALENVKVELTLTVQPSSEDNGDYNDNPEDVEIKEEQQEIEEFAVIPEPDIFYDHCDLQDEVLDSSLYQETHEGDDKDEISSDSDATPRRSVRKRKQTFIKSEEENVDKEGDPLEQDDEETLSKERNEITRKTKRKIRDFSDDSADDIVEESEWDDDHDADEDYSSSSSDAEYQILTNLPKPKRKKKGSANKKQQAFNFHCSKCGKKFKQRGRHITHEIFICKIKYSEKDIKKLKKQEDIKMFKCPVCNWITSERCLIISHYQKHKVVPDFVTCSLCPSSFPSEMNLKAHQVATGHKGQKKNEKVVKEILEQSRTTLLKILPIIGDNHGGVGGRVGRPPKDKAVSVSSSSKGKTPVLIPGGKDCSKCGKTFGNKTIRLRHEIFTCGLKYDKEMLAHFSHFIASCDLCAEVFPHKNKLISHYASHTGQKPLGCSGCDAKFLHLMALKAHHLKTGHSEGYRRDVYSQDTLNAPSTPIDLREIVETPHGRSGGPSCSPKEVGEEGEACSVCGKKFSGMINKVKHEMFNCNVDWSEKKLEAINLKHLYKKCDQCGEKFGDKFKLACHYARHTGIRPFGCEEEECQGETFGTLHAFKMHAVNTGHTKGFRRDILSQHSLDAPKVPYDLQSYLDGLDSFSSPTKRKKKSQIKNNCNNGGICEICGKDVKYYLAGHIRRYHSTEGWPHTCPHCSKGFLHLRTLNQHLNRFHPSGKDGLPLPVPVRKRETKFPCPVCQLTFPLKQSMNIHKKSHEDRSVNCSKCGKKYAFPHHLRRHEMAQPNCDVIQYPDKKTHRFTPFVKPCPFKGCGVVLKGRNPYQMHLRQYHRDEEGLEEELTKAKCPPSLYKPEMWKYYKRHQIAKKAQVSNNI